MYMKLTDYFKANNVQSNNYGFHGLFSCTDCDCTATEHNFVINTNTGELRCMSCFDNMYKLYSISEYNADKLVRILEDMDFTMQDDPIEDEKVMVFSQDTKVHAIVDNEGKFTIINEEGHETCDDIRNAVRVFLSLTV